MIRVSKLRAIKLAVVVALLHGLLPMPAGTQASNQKTSQQQPGTNENKSILGFTAAGAALERQIEEQFLKIPSAERAREWHRYLTAEPHPAASARNNELADYIAEQWRQQGWEDVVLRKYEVLHSAPREISLEMVAPVQYKATLREAPYDADPDTKNPRVSSAYLGYSASGEVTAEVVYAHSGNPEDYALLRSKGISVKGKIVLVRYSNPYSYRGFKALTAEREGAAAMLVYSDPAEDGYKQEKFSLTAPGARRATYSAARLPMTSSSPAIPPRRAGLPSPEPGAFRRKRRARCPRSSPCRSPGMTPSRCSKT